MTIPNESPPATIGSQPDSAYAVNQVIGAHLRQFTQVKTIVGQDREWLAGADLKVAPYYFTDAQETDLKTAVLQLDSALDAIDMTFISRIIGLG